MPLYDFRCDDCGEVTEARKGYNDCIIACPLCEGTAHRQAVYAYQPTITETGGSSYPANNAKDSRGRYRVSDFQEASAEIDHAVSRIEKREGKPVKMPSLYKAGLRKAERIGTNLR